MLEVEMDVFSGMPNPTWILSHKLERALFDLLRADSKQATRITSGSQRLGLGYRGLVVRHIKEDGGPWDKANAKRRQKIPAEFRLGIGPVRRDSAEAWLLKTATASEAGIPDDVMSLAAKGVTLVPKIAGPQQPGDRVDRKRVGTADVKADAPLPLDAEHHETWWACGSNYFWANAYYFNDPAHVTRNNCYCFASNHRPDIRYALPGKRGGSPATSITCAGVVAGLRADGWQNGCQPNGLTIALVIWPNRDYHFYRLVTGGPFWWWGHKPGGTPARYTDDCGHAIYQYAGRGYAPNNICRGPYTVFCDYFYQNNWTAFVA